MLIEKRDTTNETWIIQRDCVRNDKYVSTVKNIFMLTVLFYGGGGGETYKGSISKKDCNKTLIRKKWFS